MVFWYCSVGVRMALMLLSHLDPENVWYGRVLMYPLQLAPQPTVDRSLQGIRLRFAPIQIFKVKDSVFFNVHFSQRNDYHGYEHRRILCSSYPP